MSLYPRRFEILLPYIIPQVDSRVFPPYQMLLIAAVVNLESEVDKIERNVVLHFLA
jgi:hypothetical protein